MQALFLFLTLIPLVSFGHSGKTECITQANTLKIPAHTKSIQGITEDKFKTITEDMYNLYAPIFEKDYGATLVIEADWEDATVNAYAQQSGKTWKVNMFGGLARHVEATEDGYAAVICHEIGHHIAGAVKKKSWMGTTWASNEGQADYYATTKCLRKYYELPSQERKTLAIYRKGLSSFTEEEIFARKSCQEVYKTAKERAACFRSALAGKSLARLLGSLSGNAEVVFSKPDPKVATTTDHNHPKAQCRMDTYFQGALCVNDHDELPDMDDVRKGYCTAIEDFKIGLRPACWYKASEYEK